MKHYELTFLISPELTDQELEALQEKIIGILAKEPDTVIEKSRPVRKQLPSPVQKKTQAFLWSFNCSLKPDSLEDIKQKITQETSVLRYALLSKPPAALRRKPSREESFISAKSKERGKVEIGQIEKKLEEILGE